MTHLQDLASWVDANRAVLERHGKVSFTFGPPGTGNASAHLLVVVSHDEDVELLVWESGDAEFNQGVFADSVLEHVELQSPDELQVLLRRLLGVVTRT